MGYNTWNDLDCSPHGHKLVAIVEKLKNLGFDKLGYQYVTVDDCWMKAKRDKGVLTPDPKFFPEGIEPLARMIHEKGFLFGIYTDRSASTCTGRAASLGFEEQDARLFAQWGVDFVKNDGCWDPDCGPKMDGFPQSGVCAEPGRRKAVDKYKKMADAINATGRPMIHAVCGWQPWFAAVGRQIGQMWRISADVKDWPGVYEAIRIMEQLGEHHGPGGWNDPDMLIGSSPGAARRLTERQARAMFSLWAVHGAPLLLGVSVLKMSDHDLATYSNSEVIGVDQDPLGSPAELTFSNCPKYVKFVVSVKDGLTPVWEVADADHIKNKVACGGHHANQCSECPRGNGRTWCHGDCKWLASNKSCVDAGAPKVPLEDRPGPWSLSEYKEPASMRCQQVWKRNLSDGEVAVVFVNWGDAAADVDVPLAALALPWGGGATARDLWAKRRGSGAAARLEPGAAWSLGLAAAGGHRMFRLSPPRQLAAPGLGRAGALVGGSAGAGHGPDAGRGPALDEGDAAMLMAGDDMEAVRFWLSVLSAVAGTAIAAVLCCRCGSSKARTSASPSARGGWAGAPSGRAAGQVRVLD